MGSDLHATSALLRISGQGPDCLRESLASTSLPILSQAFSPLLPDLLLRKLCLATSHTGHIEASPCQAWGQALPLPRTQPGPFWVQGCGHSSF